MIKQNKFNLILILLLCGLALHYMLITIILKDNILFKFWKEILIIILLIDTIAINWLKVKNNIFLNNIDLCIILFGISLIWSAIFKSESIGSAIFVVRLYILPIIVYYIAAKNYKLTANNVYKIISIITVFYAILCIWGIFQATILGDSFLINLGYPVKYEGRLRDSYYFGGFGNMQRVMATFANTNVFAAVIGIMIILNIFNPSIMKINKHYKAIISIFVIAFILSFSRTNWIAMIFIIIILNCKNKRILKSLGAIVILVVAIGIIYSLISDISIFRIIFKYIEDTITLQDTSAAGRGHIWRNAFEIIKSNPFGIGLGKTGEVSTKLFGELIIPAESSYFAILLDLGVQGGIFYFIMMMCNIYNSIRCKVKKKEEIAYLKTTRYLLIYLLIIFISSNHIYDLEIMITSFFFIGLSRNKTFLHSISSNKNNAYKEV